MANNSKLEMGTFRLKFLDYTYWKEDILFKVIYDKLYRKDVYSNIVLGGSETAQK